jgi:hypothetical protein
VVLSVPSLPLGLLFGQAWLSFYGLDCCPHIFGVLGIDCSYIYHSFLAGWSPYSFRYNNTCWNPHFPIPNGTTKHPNHVTPRCPLSCPTFWKPSGSILPPVVSFFGRSLAWVGICFLFNRQSFEYRMNMFLLMCGSKGRRLIISSSYHTIILFIISPFSYNIMHPSWLATSYSYPPFMVLVWSYH